MMQEQEIEIREGVPGDLDMIEKLYPDAFPEEDLLPLVRDLLREPATALSLVAFADKALAGHVIFTRCGIAGGNEKVALLGPLAVAPAWQRQGIGSAIVRAGMQMLENVGASHVYVLGDPAYYSRFGFAPEASVAPPYPLPEEWREAWQSKSLHGTMPPVGDTLKVPQPWLQPALWAPEGEQVPG